VEGNCKITTPHRQLGLHSSLSYAGSRLGNAYPKHGFPIEKQRAASQSCFHYQELCIRNSRKNRRHLRRFFLVNNEFSFSYIYIAFNSLLPTSAFRFPNSICPAHHVPNCQEARYFFCSPVSLSMVMPMAASFSLAIILSIVSGTG